MGDNKRITVTEFTIPVLGGEFTVKEVIPREGSVEKTSETIRSLTPDRWFVLLAEDSDNSTDVLSLIDDDFNFVEYAAGIFKGSN
ncbi:MAG: hypothetical protein OEV94_07180 [Deltaproteobacteria bacterium]|nr:hypothetical protein [Deltaproteobacteria bacterium]